MRKFIVLFLFILILPLASAFQITVEPSEINFKNVLPDGYAEKKIIITTDSSENIDISLAPSGIFEKWISVEPPLAAIDKNNPAEFLLQLNPQQAQLGDYQGLIVANAITGGNQFTSTVSSAASIDVTVSITKKEIIQAQVTDISISNIEKKQPINIKFYILNTGNTEISPQFQIELYDAQKNLLDTLSQTNMFYPSSDEQEITMTFNNNYPVGEYQIISRVFHNDYLISQQTVPFPIVEPGNLVKEPEPAAREETIPLSTAPTMIMFLIIITIFIYFGIKRIRKKKTKTNHRK